jgi:hypothetical protein
MPVDSLTCSDCGRSDFDNFDDLLTHDCDGRSDDDPSGGAAQTLVADGGHPVGERECPDCGLITNRLDLIITSDGLFVCPGCGHIITSYGVLQRDEDHILTPIHQQRSGHVAHKPSDDHPLVPACDEKARQRDDDYYRPIPTSQLETGRIELCKFCDPEHEIDRSTSSRGHYKALKAAAEDDADLIADGGVVADGTEFQTHEGNHDWHITLRIDDLGDDGYRVSEPGVRVDETGDTLAEAIAAYAHAACDSDE